MLGESTFQVSTTALSSQSCYYPCIFKNSHHRPEDVHVAQPDVKDSSVAKVAKQQPTKATPKTLDEAISAAMLSTKIYGAHAVESRMAWELVEEMEASSR